MSSLLFTRRRGKAFHSQGCSRLILVGLGLNFNLESSEIGKFADDTFRWPEDGKYFTGYEPLLQLNSHLLVGYKIRLFYSSYRLTS